MLSRRLGNGRVVPGWGTRPLVFRIDISVPALRKVRAKDGAPVVLVG
jgi:hypothetical protein